MLTKTTVNLSPYRLQKSSQLCHLQGASPVRCSSPLANNSDAHGTVTEREHANEHE